MTRPGKSARALRVAKAARALLFIAAMGVGATAVLAYLIANGGLDGGVAHA